MSECMKPYYQDTAVTIYHGDCLEIMPTLEADSIDSIVTDPPYGLSFMGKDWDHGVPGEHFWREALRVAKPGAHLLAFGGTRTFHRLVVAIEDAGWEIRDCVMWVYGSGFPKSLDVSKAIDKAVGAERQLGPKRVSADGTVSHDSAGKRNAGWERPWRDDAEAVDRNTRVSYPATDAARQWQGWGTALKPAWEPIIVARKPLIGTVAENVQRYGTGAINVDGCRVAHDEKCRMMSPSQANIDNPSEKCQQAGRREAVLELKPAGRWPANLIHDGSQMVMDLFPVTGPAKAAARGGTNPNPMDWGNGRDDGSIVKGHDDLGGSAARFFYCAKASKADRDEGCEGLDEKLAMRYGEKAQGPLPQQTPSKPVAQRNHHPTVKPTALMRYLCRLVTPPGGVILDMFMGSGSTGKAALKEGFRFEGIDRELEYVEISKARMAQEVFSL